MHYLDVGYMGRRSQESFRISGARSEMINQIQISNHTFLTKTLNIKKHK